MHAQVSSVRWSYIEKRYTYDKKYNYIPSLSKPSLFKKKKKKKKKRIYPLEFKGDHGGECLFPSGGFYSLMVFFSYDLNSILCSTFPIFFKQKTIRQFKDFDLSKRLVHDPGAGSRRLQTLRIILSLRSFCGLQLI